jgi:phosphoenolpyruvate-protein phosphotransferase
LTIRRQTSDDPDTERARLAAARSRALDELDRLIETRRDRLAPDDLAIFDAQRLMLEDPELLAQVDEAIAEGASAERAWSISIQVTAGRLQALPDPYFQARAADIRDIGERVLRHLLGVVEVPALPDHPVVVLAEDLSPSDTVGLDTSRVLAFCTVRGGPTSHAAILARRLDLPAVVGLGKELLDVAEGETLVVDGEAGIVIVDPDALTLANAQRRQAALLAQRWELDMAAGEPALTSDGARIEVAANIGNLEDAEAAARHGADGVGLLRTEFLYLDRLTAPSEEEQVAAYRAILEALGGKPVVIRTLDVGGDKPLPYLPLSEEANPFLGVRAIRLAQQYPDLLRQQLRAILKASHGYPVRVMFPMVAVVDEIRQLRALVEEIKAELTVEGVPVTEDLQLGMMVEIPSAALLAHHFAPLVDFFSIGTNDLSQYTFAADRTNATVAALADALHPAVLQLVALVVKAAQSAGRWVGVCGELAADEVAVPVLIGLGVDELSVNPVSVPRIKAAVREWSLSEARVLAGRALDLESASAVRELIQSSLASQRHLSQFKV